VRAANVANPGNVADRANVADSANGANAASGGNGALREVAAFGAGGNDFLRRALKSVNQVPHPNAQSLADLHQM